MNWLDLIERFGAPVVMLGIATITLWRLFVRQVRALEKRNEKLEKSNEDLQTKRLALAERSAEDANHMLEFSTRVMREAVATIKGLERDKNRDGDT